VDDEKKRPEATEDLTITDYFSRAIDAQASQTSPTIDRPLGDAPSSFLLNFRPLAFPSGLPSSHLSIPRLRMTSCAACFFQIPASVTHLEFLALRVGRWCLKWGVVGYSIRLFHCIHGRAIIQTPYLSCPNPLSSFLRFSQDRSSRLPAFPD